MKHIIIMLLLLSASPYRSNSQVVAEVLSDTIFNIFDVQKIPSFPGGESMMMKYIVENVHVPSIDREQNIISSFGFRFTVGKDGSISAISMIKGAGEVAEGLVRIIRSMPCWIPAERNGKPVNCQFVLTIRIHLE